MVQTDTLQYQCKGVIYYFLSTLLLALTFFCYIIGSTILPVMDVMGWLFFVLSCLSHAAIIMLLPLAGYALLARLRQPWVAGVWFVMSVSLLLVLTMLNLQVYQLYRFHINGIILNMVFGSGASEIFNFDAAVLAKEGGILLLFVVAALGLWRLVPTLVRHTSRGKLWSMAAFLMHMERSSKSPP